MLNRVSLGFIASILLGTSALAQTAAPQPRFEAADVQLSPERKFPFADGGLLRGDRFMFRQATMVDLIAKAYGLDAIRVQGGPPWLEMVRYDIVAKAPAGTPAKTVNLMLQALLADRFHLVVHDGSVSMPAFVLTIGAAGKPKFKPADGSEETGCRPNDPPESGRGSDSYNNVACKNLTMDQFADNIHMMAGGYLTSPVVNETNLEGSWNMDLKWTSRNLLQQQGADGISIFDAVDKELGLKLELKTAPRPVLLVDSVNEKFTPNPPDTAKILPPAPPPAFEVATIKPSAPDAKPDLELRGSDLKVRDLTMWDLITLAWRLNPNDESILADAPKWIKTDHYDIDAKIPNDLYSSGDHKLEQVDISDAETMVQALIIDRFKFKYHEESRPLEAYNLIAANPKLTPANPKNRTRCFEGPGPDGKDPRLQSPILNRLLTCQNMTAAQIGKELTTQAAGYIFSPVLDQTGLKGSWDFTLSFSSINFTKAPQPGTPSPSQDTATASDPNGALSLPDAVSRQLGLKLVKVKRPVPVLVIDHLEEKPTEN